MDFTVDGIMNHTNLNEDLQLLASYMDRIESLRQQAKELEELLLQYQVTPQSQYGEELAQSSSFLRSVIEKQRYVVNELMDDLRVTERKLLQVMEERKVHPLQDLSGQVQEIDASLKAIENGVSGGVVAVRDGVNQFYKDLCNVEESISGVKAQMEELPDEELFAKNSVSMRRIHMIILAKFGAALLIIAFFLWYILFRM